MVTAAIPPPAAPGTHEGPPETPRSPPYGPRAGAVLILIPGPAVKERDEKERPGTAELLRSGCGGMETDIGAGRRGEKWEKRGWRELGKCLGGGTRGRQEDEEGGEDLGGGIWERRLRTEFGKRLESG